MEDVHRWHGLPRMQLQPTVCRKGKNLQTSISKTPRVTVLYRLALSLGKGSLSQLIIHLEAVVLTQIVCTSLH